MSDGGKGSKPRPFSVSHEEWASRWDAIFQRDLKEETKQEDKQSEGESNADESKRKQ